MAKEKKICSVLELPLITTKAQRDNLDKRFEAVRRIYNTMLHDKITCYNVMTHSAEWMEIQKGIKAEFEKMEALNEGAAGKKKTVKKTDALKELYERKNRLLREYGFSEYDFNGAAIRYSKFYQKLVSSNVAAITIGQPMWMAYQKLLYGNGEKVSFRKYGEVTSIVSNNKSGIRFLQKEDGTYYILLSNRKARAKEVRLPVKGPSNTYEREMLSADIKQVRIVKKIEKGHRKYYCQLIVGRAPFEKMNAEGDLKHLIGDGMVGICIWRDTLYAVSDTRTLCVNLVPDQQAYTKQKESLSKQLEHLRRVNNPDNFNDDGTVKKGIIKENGKREKLTWHYSNHYKKIRKQLKELERRHKVQKDLLQNEVVIKLLSMGNTFRFAGTGFLTLKPEYDEEAPLSNAEYRKKKARRKSIQDAAPSTLLNKLDRKLQAAGLEPIERITIPEELYWYRHDKGKSDKELFAGEKILVNGSVIEQSIYRAFILRYFDTSLLVYHQKEIESAWEELLLAKELTV